MIIERTMLAVGLLLILSAPAHAYIDPGSGTFLVQILAALFFGALFYLRRIRDFFIRLVSPRRREKDDAEERK